MQGLGGVGLGFRPELAGDLLRRPRAVDFVEVVAEACIVAPRARREARALAEIWPVVPHGVKLSLGSAEGIEPERARALGKLAKELRAPALSEHVAFVRSGAREIGHLTGLPLTRAALGVVEKNVALARRFLPDVPFYLENVAFGFCWPDVEMSEGDFYAEVTERTGCRLLLDVENLYANALNAGEDPFERLRRFPLERVGMIHLAGGSVEDGFYYDDHAHAIPGVVFQMLEVVFEACGRVPILIERDANFPAFSELEAELARSRAALERAASRTRDMPLAAPSADGAGQRELAREQDRIARALIESVDGDTPDGFDPEEIARARAVLQRKRVDEALPLLPRLGHMRTELEWLARAVIEKSTRPPRLAAHSDALRIAEAALERPELRAFALRDRLELRARFVPDAMTGGLRPRKFPFIGRENAEDGARLWSLKGIGSRARVHSFETGGRR